MLWIIWKYEKAPTVRSGPLSVGTWPSTRASRRFSRVFLGSDLIFPYQPTGCSHRRYGTKRATVLLVPAWLASHCSRSVSCRPPLSQLICIQISWIDVFNRFSLAGRDTGVLRISSVFIVPDNANGVLLRLMSSSMKSPSSITGGTFRTGGRLGDWEPLLELPQPISPTIIHGTKA